MLHGVPQMSVMQLELDTLQEQMKEASASCGHGVGADTGLTKEQAMTLDIFTERLLRKYFTS